MVGYQVLFDRDVEKDFKRISHPVIDKITKRILALQSNPFPRQSLKLQGTENTYRLRVGDYRILYQVDHFKREVTVYHVRHRKDVYRELS